MGILSARYATAGPEPMEEAARANGAAETLQLAVRMKTAALALLWILFIGVTALLIRFDFYVWRVQHPQAPTWTFFFKQ